MRLTLHLDKSVDENAALYYEKAKKAKRKLQGALTALERTKKELAQAKLISAKEVAEKAVVAAKRSERREWYEKFHWFRTSEGHLCVGGRDASTNEVLIKKHTLANETVLHCDIAGSPFFVIKAEAPGEISVEEAAIATASYSRAWKLGLGNVEVYAVKSAQLSKEAPSGEYLTKGSFIVRGKKKSFIIIPRIAIGIADGRVIAGPVSAVKAHATNSVELLPANTKSSETAKEIRKLLGTGDIDDIIRLLPAGGCKLAKGKG